MSLILAAIASAALAQPDWQALEAPILTDHVQLTKPDMFIKAGEAYFDPMRPRIIFQAILVPPIGQEPSPHYEMFVASLRRGRDGINPESGLSPRSIFQISQPGSANTCGWFHPNDGSVMFGSTILPPMAPDKAGYQRDSGRYRWQFPSETEIVIGHIINQAPSEINGVPTDPNAITVKPIITPLFIEPGYSAEGSWSPDGKFILYTWVNPDTGDADIYLRQPDTGYVTPIVEASGYDGGPFFSPDGHWITYRSDRQGNNLLQIFIAELSFDDMGRPDGIKREIQLTDNAFVNWGPFWHPSGAFLIYSTNEAAPEAHNYEVFAIDARAVTKNPKRLRLTYADGFDGLPVFNADGSYMMWTSQRGAALSADERPSSQVWVARFNFEAFTAKFAAPDDAGQTNENADENAASSAHP